MPGAERRRKIVTTEIERQPRAFRANARARPAGVTMHLRACALAIAVLALGCNKAQPIATSSPEPAAGVVPPVEQPAAIAKVGHDEAVARTWVGGAAASEYVLGGEQMIGLWVDVPTVDQARVPLAVTLAIDTSGSMRGAPIEHARAAARKVVETLHDGDLVALVTFDSTARTVIEPMVLGPQSRKRVVAILAELEANGGTALHAGVVAAEQLMIGAPASYLVRRVIVVSDGQATVGPVDPEQIGNVADVGMQNGVQVTALGVGLEYDEHTLDALAVRSSGRLYHLENSEGMPEIVAGELALLGSTTAAATELEVVPAPGVSLLGIDTVRSFAAGRGGLRVPLGVMFAGQKREVLLRVRLDDVAAGAHPLASVRLRYRDPIDDGIERVQESVVRATITDDPQLVAHHENPRTQGIIAMREAALLAANASKLANAGQLELASADLERAEQKLEQQALRTKGVERDKMKSGAAELRRAKRKVGDAAAAPAPARASRGRAAALDLNDVNMAFDGY